MSRTPDPTAKISLLRAAESVFADKGLGSAKVEEITRQAGLSKGAFYLHFASKEEAFKQVVESFLARLGAGFQSPSHLDVPHEPNKVLKFTLARDVEIYEFLWQNRAIVRILSGCHGEYVYLLEAFREGIRKTAKEWVELWKSRGLFRPEIDTDVVTMVMCGGYNELTVRMLASARRPPIEDWLAKAQDMFVRALGTARLTLANADLNRPVIVDRKPKTSRGIHGRRTKP